MFETPNEYRASIFIKEKAFSQYFTRRIRFDYTKKLISTVSLLYLYALVKSLREVCILIGQRHVPTKTITMPMFSVSTANTPSRIFIFTSFLCPTFNIFHSSIVWKFHVGFKIQPSTDFYNNVLTRSCFSITNFSTFKKV